MRRVPLFAVCLACLFLRPASAQNLCPTGVSSDKLICVIPQVFGPNGLEAKNPAVPAQFDVNFLTSGLSALQSSIARQSALLPLASPSSGFIYTWNPSVKAFVASPDSFGPILGERADTIGKGHLYLGFDYQYFNFTELDGQNLKTLPIAMPQTPTDFGGGTLCDVNSNDPLLNMGTCGPIRDVIATTNHVNLKVHQYSAFLTYGITPSIDVSLAIPIMNVRFGITSDAVIHQNDDPARFPAPYHTFENCPGPTYPANCFNHSYPNSQTASGIGDLVLRVKGTPWKTDMQGVALGVDVRMPTGDSLNFLGTGAPGVRPFAIWSHRGRVSPHGFVGFQINGSSKIAGDITTGSEDKIPGSIDYSAGADVRATRILTVAGDVVGEQMFQALRSKRTTYTEPVPCVTDSSNNVCGALQGTANIDPTLTHYTGSFNLTYFSIGAKIQPISTLLISGNALIPLNSGGLKPQVVPLVGVSYTF
jgi:hypothetical protein